MKYFIAVLRSWCSAGPESTCRLLTPLGYSITPCRAVPCRAEPVKLWIFCSELSGWAGTLEVCSFSELWISAVIVSEHRGTNRFAFLLITSCFFIIIIIIPYKSHKQDELVSSVSFHSLSSFSFHSSCYSLCHLSLLFRNSFFTADRLRSPCFPVSPLCWLHLLRVWKSHPPVSICNVTWLSSR